MTILVLWLHLMAVVSWIGGMLFLSLVLVPVFKRVGFTGERRQLFLTLALRFRAVVWASILVLVLTGPLLLIERGEDWSMPAGWPVVLQLKLTLVALLISFTAVHDFWLGPKVGHLMRTPPDARSSRENGLIRLSPWIARLGLVLAIMVLFLGLAVGRM